VNQRPHNGAGFVDLHRDPSAAAGRRVVWDTKSILFSSCNEDSCSELRAFGNCANQDLLCVTAGGGRALALLLAKPRSIVAVDLNPAQNALLELKIAAMRQLDHDAYLRFLGVRADDERLQTYRLCRSALTSTARSFFDAHTDEIAAGILYQGRLERFLARVASAARFAQPLGLRRLLDARDLDEQRAVVAKVDTPFWRAIMKTFVRRSVLRMFSGDPGFFRYLPDDMKLHDVLYDCVFTNLRSGLLRENQLLQLVLFGRYVWEETLPPYLNAVSYDAVKSALATTEVRIVTSTVNEALQTHAAAGFGAYSLSDISSYLDDAAHHELFERILATARLGARVCSRSILRHRPLAREHAARLQRDADLERDLAARDHACVHAFVVGTVT